MASTYQLLVHARLVGLGKRFDRFLSSDQVIRKEKGSNDNGATVIAAADAPGAGAVVGPSASTEVAPAAPAANPATSQLPLPAATDKTSPGESIRTAQAALAKILPSDVNLDYTMMEHLARAAMELHNRRTGRGMLQKKETERQKLMSHEKEIERKNMILERDRRITQEVMNGSSSGVGGAGVAWSSLEKQKCLKAAEMYGKDDVGNIARTVGTRTEAEVKAHLKNIDGMKRVERDLDLVPSKKSGDDNSDMMHTHHSPASPKQQPGAADTPTVSVPGSGSVAGVGTPEKKKSRKKAAPKAILTVPSTTFDAKKMLFEPI